MFDTDPDQDPNSPKVVQINQVCGQIFAYFFLIPMVFNTVFGYVGAVYGHIRKFLVVAFFMLLISLALLLVYPPTINIYLIIIPFIINGFAYSIYSPLIWSIIKYEVDEKHIGTAFGIVFSIYNIIGSVYLVIYGAITDHYNDTRKGYYIAQIVLTIFVVIGFFLTIWFYFIKSGTRDEENKIYKERKSKNQKLLKPSTATALTIKSSVQSTTTTTITNTISNASDNDESDEEEIVIATI